MSFGGPKPPTGFNSNAPSYPGGPPKAFDEPGIGTTSDHPEFVPPPPKPTANLAATPAPAAPTADDPAVVAAKDAAAAEQARPRGRSATLLTGGSGLLNGPSLARRILLGS